MEFVHPTGVADLVMRLSAATVIGGLIGVDREARGKPAGLRTHALVSLGAALVTIVTIRLTGEGIVDANAISRAIQGIVAGVGFLGAGAILKTNGTNTEMVQGLTTAATIWFVASLGIACGAGQWFAGLIAVGFALLILIVGGPIEGLVHRLFHKRRGRDSTTGP
ncbi:MAG: putative Mg2+ transporter-C (MgtC) family protein [Acidobacteriota bacterium]|jgi:putative Mg2+ transporter-C (MgtC) family protein|nr:putative Mg2+ transporter-C (MgtC) family protein [Acidobacteriota bacterium]